MAYDRGIFDESSRKSTDKFWLVLFIVCFVAYVVVISLSFGSGGPNKLSLFMNDSSKGHTCGFDSDVLQKPKQILIDQRLCTSKSWPCGSAWICAKKCPTGKLNLDLDVCKDSEFETLKKQMICTDDVKINDIENCQQANALAAANKCVRWYSDPDDFFNACYSENDDASKLDLNGNLMVILKKMIVSLIIAILIGVAITAVFILTLRWSAGCIFWTFIGLILTFILAGIVTLGYLVTQVSEENKEAKTPLYVFIGMLSIMLLVFLLLLFCFRKKIRYGIEIVKEASRCVFSSIFSMTFPLLTYILRILFVIMTIFAIGFALTIRKNEYKVEGNGVSDCICSKQYSPGDACLPDDFNNDCKTDAGQVCLTKYCRLASQEAVGYAAAYVAISFLTLLWIVAFIQANTKMILAHVFGNWYWNWNQNHIPASAVPTAMGKILGNHTGTAAFGSLVITICRILRSLLRESNSGNSGGTAALIMKILCMCLKACLAGLLRLIEFISDKAFVMCAIHGTSFWNSAVEVSSVMVKDIPLVASTNYVGDIILGVCKFFVAFIGAVVFYVTIPLDPDNKEVHDFEMFAAIVASIVVFILLYDLASILLTSYDIAIDTIMVCVMEDFKRCQEADKAYFQSDSLNELLLKQPQPA